MAVCLGSNRCTAITAWTCCSSIAQAQTVSAACFTYSPKPWAMAWSWASLNVTGGYFNTSRGSEAPRITWSVAGTTYLVVRPYRNNSHAPTNSDHDPRGSLGNQNPYAPKIR